jgi:hypothetical protein
MRIGPHLSDEMARDVSRMWGGDPVHPIPEAYDTLACAIESDILTDGVRYINPPKVKSGLLAKKNKMDLSLSRQGWVDGCSAAVARRDTERSHGSYNPGRGWDGALPTRERAGASEGNSRGRKGAAVGVAKSDKLIDRYILCWTHLAASCLFQFFFLFCIFVFPFSRRYWSN